MERQTKEIVLGSGQYVYMQDLTNGTISVHAGPCVVNHTTQSRPVIYDPKVKDGWVALESLADAVRSSPIAVEGYYLVLFNPPKQAGAEQQAIEAVQPRSGLTGKIPPDLDVGKRVNIPGPATFPLWPGQHAVHIKGHHLRSNQYLKVQVYNEASARANWKNAVVQSTSGDNIDLKRPQDLTVGTVLLVKGTDVSFYIPPTGIKVLQREAEERESDASNTDNYVRNALTLERLEYAILVDEDGTKRLPRGPAVVFPEPTEKFVQTGTSRRFRALELTPIQGIHLKVIAPYTEYRNLEGEIVEPTEEQLADLEQSGLVARFYKEGEELFITGKETSIYYPREEHSLIKYDGNVKHFATAIPEGEGRYILDRLTGEIKIEKGPAMSLPDPREEVFARRPLSDEECKLWYPGNEEALIYNRELRKMAEAAPTTRAGVVSEGEYTRNASRAQKLASNERAGVTAQTRAAVLSGSTLNNAAFAMEGSLIGAQNSTMLGDQIERGSTYNEPRTLTLNTRFQGVPTIRLWPGYAVMVSKRGGGRRAVVGPATIHLEYDEYLEVLSLSTGKPKTTDQLFKTVYLKTTANKVADMIEVETSDHVKVNLKLSYKIDFTGNPEKWFEVENYVKYFTDRARSILKGEIHHLSIQDFYADYTAQVRRILRTAQTSEDAAVQKLQFVENGMVLDDVDVLEVAIQNGDVKRLLDSQQSTKIAKNIEIANLETERAAVEEIERLRREISDLRLVTKLKDTENAIAATNADDAVAEAKRAIDRGTAEAKYLLAELNTKVEDHVHAANLARSAKSNEAAYQASQKNLELLKDELKSKTDAAVITFGAVSPGFTEAITAAQQPEIIVRLAEATSIQRIIGGSSLLGAVEKIFKGTPMEKIATEIVSKLPAGTVSKDGGSARI